MRYVKHYTLQLLLLTGRVKQANALLAPYFPVHFDTSPPRWKRKELSPDIAGKILDADFQNIVKKEAAGKPLTVAERARIESRAAGSEELTAA